MNIRNLIQEVQEVQNYETPENVVLEFRTFLPDYISISDSDPVDPIVYESDKVHMLFDEDSGDIIRTDIVIIRGTDTWFYDEEVDALRLMVY